MADLSRCSWCGRKGTLTSLSAGNRCVLEDDCYDARQESLARAAFLNPSESVGATNPESVYQSDEHDAL